VLILAASRMLYAMAEHGELPAPLASVHAGFRTPAIAVIVTTAIMLALTLSGTFSYLITISVLSRLVTYIATCSALSVLRRRANAPASTFRLPAGDAIAAAAVLLALWLLSNSKLVEARDTAIAIAVGLAFYFANRLYVSLFSARST
jgi:amino acid transporter